MDTACELVIPIAAVRSRDAVVVGSKGARLGDLVDLGIRVPYGVCLTVAAYEEFLKSSQLSTSLRQMHDMAVQGGDLLEISSRAKCLIADQNLPRRVRSVIEHAFNELTASSSVNAGVAVRSSAIAEDMTKASFAGIYDSYLSLSTLDEVLEAVRNCWISFWSERALLYRRSKGLDHLPITGGVILQTMLQAELSGVMFTQDPTGQLYAITIEAHAGTGEALVSGSVTPDRYVVSRLGQGSSRPDFTLRGCSFTKQLTLRPDDIRQLCNLGIHIERFYQTPQDVEWVKLGSEFYVLQTRAITTALPCGEELPDSSIWTRDNLDERFPGPVKPLEASVVAEWVFTPGFTTLFRALNHDSSRGREVFRTFGGYPHLNKREIASALRGLPAPILSQLFDRNRQQDSVATKITVSRELITILMRIGRIVYHHHKEFAHAVEHFQRAYDQYHACPLEGMTPEQLISQLNSIGDSIAGVSSGHLQSIIAAEALFGVLSTMMTPGAVLDLVSHSPCELYANESVMMEQRFEELVKEVRLNREVRHKLLNLSADEALTWLRESQQSTYCLWLLERFLDRYGHRSYSYPLSHPRWCEQPEQVIELIKRDLIHQNGGEAEEIENLSPSNTSSEGANAQGKWPRRALVRTLVRYASIYGNVLRENEGFYITMPFPDLKRILFAIAEHLQRTSAIGERDDIYFLTLDELREFAVTTENLANVRTLVESRKQYSYFPTPHRGTGQHPADGIFNGNPASPGIVQGNVSILHNPTEPFQPGHILVTHTLNAAWLPILRKARGVVTDLGGILSHAAVITREFGVPAVLGVSGATVKLVNGQRITVNGNRGEVSLSNIGGEQ